MRNSCERCLSSYSSSGRSASRWWSRCPAAAPAAAGTCTGRAPRSDDPRRGAHDGGAPHRLERLGEARLERRCSASRSMTGRRSRTAPRPRAPAERARRHRRDAGSSARTCVSERSIGAPRNAAASDASRPPAQLESPGPASGAHRPQHDARLGEVAAEPPSPRLDGDRIAAGREVVEEVLRQVALGEPLEQLDLLHGDGGLRDHGGRQVAMLGAEPVALAAAHDHQPEQLARDHQRRVHAPAPPSRRRTRPCRTATRRARRARVGARDRECEADVAQADHPRRVRSRRRGAQPEPLAVRLEQVDVAAVHAEQGHDARGDRGQQLHRASPPPRSRRPARTAPPASPPGARSRGAAARSRSRPPRGMRW